MSDYFVGNVIAFRGDDELCIDEGVLVEVTELSKSGDVEIAFDSPTQKNVRMYLRFSVVDLMKHMTKMYGAETA